jgi:hypothetical protein
MRLQLIPNPDTPSEAVAAIAVEIARPDPATLNLRYTLTGGVGRLAVPGPAAPGRADDLWRHTCFEAFLRPQTQDGPGAAYVEFNFAPSTQWAAYSFTGYREGAAPAPIAAPRIQLATTDEALDLTVQLNLAGLNLRPGPCWLALCAVVEETTGAKSYWALAHPPGRPDFHHRSSFACRLPAWEAP